MSKLPVSIPPQAENTTNNKIHLLVEYCIVSHDLGPLSEVTVRSFYLVLLSFFVLASSHRQLIIHCIVVCNMPLRLLENQVRCPKCLAIVFRALVYHIIPGNRRPHLRVWNIVFSLGASRLAQTIFLTLPLP